MKGIHSSNFSFYNIKECKEINKTSIMSWKSPRIMLNVCTLVMNTSLFVYLTLLPEQIGALSFVSGILWQQMDQIWRNSKLNIRPLALLNIIFFGIFIRTCCTIWREKEHYVFDSVNLNWCLSVIICFYKQGKINSLVQTHILFELTV